MNAEPVKFLIVDDVEENLVALEALLRRDGLEILRARSGMEALELLLVHEVALALLDVQMPGMDGFELAELMRGSERTKRVPIIFVTAGNRDQGRVFKGYESGAVDFLYKPIEPRVLKSKADVFFELYEQRKEYARALQMNEMFVGILGHDLRNPLNALLTGAQLLEAQIGGEEKPLRTLQRMASSGRRMRDMIEQLLDLTRARVLDGVGLARTRQPANVTQLVQRTVEELQSAHPERQIAVESPNECVTAGDPDRLLQLLSNLVANAVQHGQGETPVTVSVKCDSGAVNVLVHNQGVIPPELLPTLFDPFRRRQTARTKSQGLGLGLYIAQQIALAHGGNVQVASTPEAGTVFSVRLPRLLPDEKRPDSSRLRKTILVIDDDRDTRDSLKRALEVEGYSALTASDGREAVERLSDGAQRPDLVVLDMVLPVTDGHRVYEALQTDPMLAGIPVVVASSAPSGTSLEVVVVPRPFRLERLLKTVAGLFEEPGREGLWR